MCEVDLGMGVTDDMFKSRPVTPFTLTLPCSLLSSLLIPPELSPTASGAAVGKQAG